MIIERDLKDYKIHTDDSIQNAVKRIAKHREQIIFVVNENNVLQGLITNGDILRWLTTQNSPDLNQTVSHIVNTNYSFCYVDAKPEEILPQLNKYLYVPLIDKQRHLICVARKRAPGEGIRISGCNISSEAPAFIIAEIGINHNGSVKLAKELVDHAVAAGADCAKFQMRHMEALYSNQGNSNDTKENLGSQYILDILSKFQLTNDEMFEIFDYCKQKGIMPLCTPWERESVAVLEKYGMPAYKIASADMTNHDLLEAVAKTGKPILCSTGMSSEDEIVEMVKLLRRYGAQYILLHCNSTYPTAFKDVNLKYLDRLKKIGDCPVGYSGHERGYSIPIAAVAMGAKVIEKHITVDRKMEGNDHKVSLLPQEFKAMVDCIRQVEESLGTAQKRMPGQGELMNRATLAKSLVINRGLKKGEKIEAKMIEVRSPGRGLQPNKKLELIGTTAKRDLNAGDFFYPSDLEKEIVRSRPYSFKRHWGVPVRYYDYKVFLAKTNLKFLEFHLSYKDIEEDVHKHLTKEYDLDLTVHSPDFFQGDHILNLCSTDPKHREHSIYEVQRVINVTRQLQKHFKKTKRTLVITSMGGFSFDRFLDASERQEQYDILEDSLSKLDSKGVELIAQTLPPFPWYYGGQSYCNLFMEAKDTAEFCKKNNMRICFDLCHSKLACNYFGWSFSEFIKTVGPHTAHLHVSDASGVDGEGVQVGEGDMDFPSIASDLDKYCPTASFIPEVWQGHENEGEGCWIALERIEGLF